jgi:hypothetical protein
MLAKFSRVSASSVETDQVAVFKIGESQKSRERKSNNGIFDLKFDK